MNNTPTVAPLTSTIGVTDWLQFVASFALVLGLLFALLWWLRQLQNRRGFGRKDGELEILETLGVGVRQKIMLVRVRDRAVLIGVGPNHMQALTGWLDEYQTTMPPKSNFAQTISQLKDTP
jgi:flagellar protein FliO/FliZ